MMPISLYQQGIDLERYASRLNALVVSSYDSDRSNHQRFLSSQFPNSRVDVSNYNDLTRQLTQSQYDVLVLDNDAFFVDKSPALDSLPGLGEFIDRKRVIVIAAIADQGLVERVNTLGATFIEKGRWKTLEQTVKDVSGKYQVDIKAA